MDREQEKVMAVSPIAAKLHPMTSDEQARERGQRIEKRITGKFTKVEVARSAGVSRQTVDNAIEGKAAPKSMAVIEAALDTLEDRKAHPEDYVTPKQLPGKAAPITERTISNSDLIEFEISGVFGVERIIVRGPVADHEILAADVARIVRDIRATTTSEQPEGSASED